MTWVKLDDQFPDHPKVVSAGGDAAWLYVAGLCYCQAKLTNGIIPAGVVPRLTDRKHPAKLASRLVSVGLWEVVGEDYKVHDYDEYNEDSTRIKHKRELARERVAKWRRERGRNAVRNDARTEDVTRNNESNETRNERDRNAPPLTANRYPLTANHLETPQPRARVLDLAEYLGQHPFFSLILDTTQFAHAACDAYPELDLVSETKRATLWLESNSTDNSAGRFLENWFKTADKDRVSGRGGGGARGGFMTAGEKTAEASNRLMRRAQERERKMAAGGGS